jgi:ribosome-associated protein
MLEERLAADILLLDVREVTLLADFFVLCTANSQRQINALVGDLSKQLKAEAGRPLGIEGEPESGWMLLDYGDVVVHILSKEMREFYALDELWKGAQTIVHIQ